MAKTYYQVLDVPIAATTEEIRKAYRRKAKSVHPDVNPATDAAKKFVLLTEAFEILSDPEKRKVYDLRLRRDRRPATAARAAHRSPSSGNRPPTNQENYEAWVRQARQRAQQEARRGYADSAGRSRVEKAELEVFHGLQYVLIGFVFVLGLALLLFPILAMFKFRWWMVFSALFLAPFAFKIMGQSIQGWKQLRS